MDRINERIQTLQNRKELELHELCDCGDHIRHFNGGNYHKMHYYALRDGKIYKQETTTCEYTRWSEKYEITESELREDLAECSDWWSEDYSEPAS